MIDETATEAARGLRAKLDAAALEALQAGHSWAEGPYSFPEPDYFAPRPLWEPQVLTVECKAGPVDHDWQPPEGWRMIRHSDWVAAGRPGLR